MTTGDKSIDAMALDLILAGDEAGLSRLVARVRAELNNEIECPACGDAGPHEDNGAIGFDFTLACRACHEQWQPWEVIS